MKIVSDGKHVDNGLLGSGRLSNTGYLKADICTHHAFEISKLYFQYILNHTFKISKKVIYIILGSLLPCWIK